MLSTTYKELTHPQKLPLRSPEFLLVANMIIITPLEYTAGSNVITLTLFDHTNQAAVVQERRL